MDNNVLFINKPKNITSFDICYKLRKVLNTKKIGHTGTLDPNATGVMIVLFDKATKAAQFLTSDKKTYKGKVLFGIETDTLDIDGKVLNTAEYSIPDKQELIDTLNSFLGISKQIVPLTSAKKVNGKKLYEYQYKGIDVEQPVIDINVYSIELTNLYNDGFEFICEVSSGTYIRALAQDILKRLNTIGTLSDLTRIKVDEISIDMCDDLDSILNGNYRLHNIYELLSIRYKVIDYENINDILNGKAIRLDINDDSVLICKGQEPLAIYKKENDIYKCVRGLW